MASGVIANDILYMNMTLSPDFEASRSRS
ncbi:uncharacterized protein G2W53_040647 [Senna tora]|uniref:Uncharacterized protein n=1 Tax=Senna tora TaxID=362788 RepID=A0A834SEF7_9FABA|nr:uncharacterized protein G2W53_040647 [Senna tora]